MAQDQKAGADGGRRGRERALGAVAGTASPGVPANAAGAHRSALDLAMDRYTSGLENFLSVLDARSAPCTAPKTRSRIRCAPDRIKALGAASLVSEQTTRTAIQRAIRALKIGRRAGLFSRAVACASQQARRRSRGVGESGVKEVHGLR